jgi:hypothetical protein
MENNNFINTWEQKKHVPENEKLDNKMITQFLKPKLSKVNISFTFNLVFYLLALIACIVMLSMNLYGYRTNPVMLAVESALLGLSLIFLGYGIFIFMKIREINNFSKDLRELLNSKIKFLRFYYEIWLIITAFVAWILSFALGTLVDNQDGIFRINKVGLFILITVIMLVFIYGVQKMSAEISLKTLKAILADLENSYMGQTEKIELRRKKMRWLYLALTILVTITALLGLMKFIGII